MKRILTFLFMILTPWVIIAQCAMCRTQIKNNVSAGETTVAEGLNNGIMFLFFTPYIVVFLIIFLWYKKSKITKSSRLNDRLNSQSGSV